MKFFKHFSYSELKLMCELLDKKHCYFRHTQKHFIECLDQYLVDLLLDGGCIKESKTTGQPCMPQVGNPNGDSGIGNADNYFETYGTPQYHGSKNKK